MSDLKEQFLNAANWAINGGPGINIRRMKIDDERNVTLFNGSKGLLFDGLTHAEQPFLKGLIVEERNGQAVKILAGCLRKFYNYKEPSEKNRYQEYLERDDVSIIFLKKEDGVNVRPWYCEATSRVEFATRGTLLGFAANDIDVQEDETMNSVNLDYGVLARQIAEEKYPILLDKDFVSTYSLIFEMIHPESRIITDYGDTKDLILLAGFHLEYMNDLSRNILVLLAGCTSLKIVEPWFNHSVKSNMFYDMLPMLEQKWEGTDHEGTVVLFTDAKCNPLYRLKIKNAEYLATLRMTRFCTLKNLRSMIEENDLQGWDEIRTHLYKSTTINEEIEMAYKTHYQTYFDWKNRIGDLHAEIYIQYGKLPFFETQKEFALYIKNHPYKSFFFELHKSNTSREKIYTMLEKLIPLGSEEE